MFRFLIIDFLRGTTVVFNYFKYKRIFRRSPTALINLQKKNLINFLKRVRENEAFKAFFKGITIKDIYNDPEKVLRQAPVIDKEFIKKNFNKIFNQRKGAYEENFTGGSTGTPFKYILDKRTISRVKAFNYYLWNKYLGYKFGDKILVIGGSSLGANSGFKKRLYNFLQNKIFIPGDIIDAKQYIYIDKLINRKYKIIYGYPSSILSYVSIAQKKNLCFKNKIKGVVTTSEMLLDKDKKIIEDFFSTSVLNIYGANDGGLISGSIDNKNFLYNGVDCFVEEYQQTIEGMKELVLTNLNSRVFPFLRYKVGDIGEVNNKSDIGPFVLTNIYGRTRDFFKNTKGEIFHGVLINKILKDFKEIEKYQLIQYEDFNIIFYIKTTNKELFEKIANNVYKKLTYLINDENITINIKYKEIFKNSVDEKLKLIISDAI